MKLQASMNALYIGLVSRWISLIIKSFHYYKNKIFSHKIKQMPLNKEAKNWIKWTLRFEILNRLWFLRYM